MIAMPNPRLPWYLWLLFIGAAALFFVGMILWLLAWAVIASLCWLGCVIGEGIARITWGRE